LIFLEITYQQYGSKGILLSWPQNIDDDILKDIILIKELLLVNEGKELLDVTNGYATLLLIYREDFKFPLKVDYLKKLITTLRYRENKIMVTKDWIIPVCYHESFGVDLEDFSQSKRMNKQQVIDKHIASSYRVYCKGFLTGFMYLGGLNSELHMPRKSKPKLRVPKNSVAIGGKQTGIYPCESPGGWHIIGRTPIILFDVHRKPFSEIAIGDTIRFKEISLADYIALEANNVSLHNYGE